MSSKTHIFNGKRYKIEHLPHSKLQSKSDAAKNEECWGKAVLNEKLQFSKKKCGEKHKLEIYIHEVMHSLDFTLDEEYVSRAAKDMSEFLYKLGYRQIAKNRFLDD